MATNQVYISIVTGQERRIFSEPSQDTAGFTRAFMRGSNFIRDVTIM